MTMTQPGTRIRYTEGVLSHLQGDVEDWKKAHDALVNDCYVWEDIIDRSASLYDRIVQLESLIQEDILAQKAEFCPEQDARVTSLYAEWIKLAEDLFPHVVRLEQQYGSVDEVDRLRGQYEEAKAVLDSRDFEKSLPSAEELTALGAGNPDLSRYRD